MHNMRKFAKFLSPHSKHLVYTDATPALPDNSDVSGDIFQKESTIVNYVSLVRAATGDQWKPGTVCLRKVDLTQRGGLGTVACLAGSPGCGGSPTQCATAVESSRGVNGGRLSRPCAGTSSTVDLSEQQRTNSNQ